MGVIANTNFSYKVKEGNVLYSIYQTKGGEIPACLRGQWSDLRQMQQAVLAYTGRDERIISEQQAEEEQKKKNLLASKKRESKLTKSK